MSDLFVLHCEFNTLHTLQYTAAHCNTLRRVRPQRDLTTQGDGRISEGDLINHFAPGWHPLSDFVQTRKEYWVLTPVAGSILHDGNSRPNLQARICEFHPAEDFRADLELLRPAENPGKSTNSPPPGELRLSLFPSDSTRCFGKNVFFGGFFSLSRLMKSTRLTVTFEPPKHPAVWVVVERGKPAASLERALTTTTHIVKLLLCFVCTFSV